MAKKRSGARGGSTAADRAQGGSGRGRKSGAGHGTGRAQGFGTKSDRHEQLVGRRQGREQEGGLWSGARDLAENVGQSTKGMAQNVGETAQGMAHNVSQSAKGMAHNVSQSAKGMAQNVSQSAKGMARNVGETAQTTMDTAREWAAGAADAAGSVAGKVRDNPWPSLLLGAGATWMAIDAIRARSSEDVRGRGKERGGRSGRRQERGAVSQAVSKVAQAGRTAGGQIEGFVRDRPLLAGAATLGLGMAVGMVLPSSLAENEMLGEARDNVVRRAKGAARETMEKVRDVTDTIERIGPFASGRSKSSHRGGR